MKTLIDAIAIGCAAARQLDQDASTAEPGAVAELGNDYMGYARSST